MQYTIKKVFFQDKVGKSTCIFVRNKVSYTYTKDLKTKEINYAETHHRNLV